MAPTIKAIIVEKNKQNTIPTVTLYTILYDHNILLVALMEKYTVLSVKIEEQPLKYNLAYSAL